MRILNPSTGSLVFSSESESCQSKADKDHRRRFRNWVIIGLTVVDNNGKRVDKISVIKPQLDERCTKKVKTQGTR